MIQEGQKKKKYIIFLYLLLGCGILLFITILYIGIYRKIPTSIKLKSGIEEKIELNLPVSGEIIRADSNHAVEVIDQNTKNISERKIYVDLAHEVTMKAEELNSYYMNLKLFGVIPFKQVEIQVIEEECLIPMGIPIGIYVKTQGVLVIGVGEFSGPDGIINAPAKYLLKAGDYIVTINGNSVNSKQDFINIVENCAGEKLILTVQRKEEVFDLEVKPALNQNGNYKIGVWIRDNAQGIGTMTFMDENGNFGALGHGINDIDTGTLMDINSGTLYDTNIVSIKRGIMGEPGEITGMISYTDNNILGVVTDNTKEGIFGYCDKKMMKKEVKNNALPIGLKQEIKAGPAQIICSIEGETKYYDVEIVEIYMDNSSLNRDMLLKITDENLLSLTGGIVQGMSGSPIIQEGKLVGAVTHVLVNDPAKGYGIFIENMLRATE